MYKVLRSDLIPTGLTGGGAVLGECCRNPGQYLKIVTQNPGSKMANFDDLKPLK